MGHIYKITNTITKKAYIGWSESVNSRWNDHRTGKGSKLVHQAIRKYGIENISFEILLEADVSNEDHYIKLYNTMAPNGYNLTPGGGLPPNHKGKTYEQIYGKEQAIVQRDNRLKTKLMSNRLGGVKSHQDETKAKIKQSVIIAHSNRDCSHSDATKSKIGQANKGRLAGPNNPKAKNWILIAPDGTEHCANGNLRTKCKELGLSFGTMHAAHLTNRIPNRGNAAGWQIKHAN